MKEERFFYTPDIENSDFLPQDEAIHALRVLRLCVDDSIVLMDGKGVFYKAVITETSKKICRFRVVDSIFNKKSWNTYIHIAVAPTKNIDRIEWFVEKAIEIGVDEISFINTNFTERKRINIERLEKIAISAMKQSRKPFKTIINDLLDFSAFINNAKQENKFICHCYNNEDLTDLKRKVFLKNVVGGLNDALVIIGPEGDFSVDEVLMAYHNDFMPVSLGESRLRTETAAIVAVHIMNLFNS
mgnify:CR=1 FL=1